MRKVIKSAYRIFENYGGTKDYEIFIIIQEPSMFLFKRLFQTKVWAKKEDDVITWVLQRSDSSWFESEEEVKKIIDEQVPKLNFRFKNQWKEKTKSKTTIYYP